MSNQIDIISADVLADRLIEDISNSKVKIAAKSLVDAINDWPTLNLSEPKDFLLELRIQIGTPLSFERVRNHLKNLSVSNAAWKIEAMSSLLEVFEYDKTKTLDEILIDITECYK
jgi:hypothetical protein